LKWRLLTQAGAPNMLDSCVRKPSHKIEINGTFTIRTESGVNQFALGSSPFEGFTVETSNLGKFSSLLEGGRAGAGNCPIQQGVRATTTPATKRADERFNESLRFRFVIGKFPDIVTSTRGQAQACRGYVAARLK
jgi:hypothetical protein